MELPHGQKPFDIAEVRFKNGRKDFYRIPEDTTCMAGDIVAVESSPGHDIGVVSISGELVRLQMKKKGIRPSDEIKKIYRKAKEGDIEKWHAARDLETPTMHRTREIAMAMGLKMKISDVEYQGDKSKAVFYYTADDRVDFRELIKVLGEEFKVRIEMKQIGARQEASRLGGIGSCGRELCCSTWLTDFRSVATSAARYQQLSLNPLKLAGQCGKLKCCLNYELDSYLDALKDFPENHEKIKTARGLAFLQKTDIFRRKLWYAYSDDPSEFIGVSVERVKEIQEIIKQGKTPDDLLDKARITVVEKQPDYENVVGQDSLTRFDKKKKKKKKKPTAKVATGGDLSVHVKQPQPNPRPDNRPGNRPPRRRPDKKE
jgi:cell fate regulator YaaT (PSP1 superfamily)